MILSVNAVAQFYVIMNVVRNVLLVPPPTNVSKKQQQQRADTAAEDENLDHKFLVLTRDPTLLEKNGFKGKLDMPLDVSSKQHREELKILIEEYLHHKKLEVYVGTARLMEVAIGKCVWILRSAASAASENAVAVTIFTGLQATVYFGEDRCVFHLLLLLMMMMMMMVIRMISSCAKYKFEIQRMWAEKRSGDAAAGAGGAGSIGAVKESMMQPNLREEAADICMVCLERFSSADLLNDADLAAVKTSP